MTACGVLLSGERNMSQASVRLDETKKAHAKYSASGSRRWLSCAGSIALSEKAPEPAESRYAKEGTDAHSVLEYLVKNRSKRKAAGAFLRKKYPAAMVTHAEDALRYVEGRLAEYPGAELLVEVKCDLPVSEPSQFGTTDLAILDHFGRLIVIDYKYGAGIPVYPSDGDGPNSQLAYYALGLAHQYDYNFSEVELVILQPRRPIGDGENPGVRSAVFPVEILQHTYQRIFEEGIQRAKLAAKSPENHLMAGDHCRFCPAAVICPEIKNKALREAQADFDDDLGEVDLPAVTPKSLTPETLSRVLPALDKLETWIGAVRDFAEKELERGKKIAGYALVDKRGTRVWTNPAKAAKEAHHFFGEEAFTKPELLTPAQFEKKVGDAVFVAKRTATVSSGVKLGREESCDKFTHHFRS